MILPDFINLYSFSKLKKKTPPETWMNRLRLLRRRSVKSGIRRESAAMNYVCHTYWIKNHINTVLQRINHSPADGIETQPRVRLIGKVSGNVLRHRDDVRFDKVRLY